MEIILRKQYSKAVNYWLIGLLFLISIIVIVGGLTRLTDSGLSITTWDVVAGILPPLNNQHWDDLFDLYMKFKFFKALKLFSFSFSLGILALALGSSFGN